MSKKSQKPRLIFVFAHPDDDAFGPSGTLIHMSQEYEIIFLCATRGEQGKNHGPDKKRSIADIREAEVRASAKVIGASHIHFLNFLDGSLCNNNYHSLAEKIESFVKLYQPEILMTWETNGVSGHLDHIAVSMVTHFVFEKSECVKKLMLYCLSTYQTKQFLEGYFVYRPPGYEPNKVDIVVDISRVWERKIEAMRCHKSQINDFQKIINRPKIRLMEDCFLIRSKEQKI